MERGVVAPVEIAAQVGSRRLTDPNPKLFEFCATHPGRDVTLSG